MQQGNGLMFLIKRSNSNPHYEVIHLLGLISLMRLEVQKDKEFRSAEPHCAAHRALKSIPLHYKWSHPAHLHKVKEPVLQAELHRSVRWHTQQRLSSGVV